MTRRSSKVSSNKGEGRGSPNGGACQHGFTIIEVVVATLVVMVAAAALSAVIVGSVAAVELSRQGQQASNLASSVVAEVEGLPWSTVSSGLSNVAASDPRFSTDSNISSSGAAAGNQCFEGMPLVVAGSAPTASTCSALGSAQGGSAYAWQDVSGPSCVSSLSATISASTTAPLVPHISCVTLNGTGFEIATYATLYSGTSATAIGAQMKVTAVVTWAGGQSSSTGLDRETDSVILASCTGAARCA